MFKVTDRGVAVRRMLQSFVVSGAGDFVFREGECWAFPSAAAVPATVAAHSEPVEDVAAAGRIQHFDAEDYARRTRPRPAPKAEPTPMTKGEVLLAMSWTDAQLSRAIADVGFPKPGGYLSTGDPIWERARVEKYREAAVAAPVPATLAGVGAWLR